MKFSLKRILSFVLALVMILGMVPQIAPHAHAADVSLLATDTDLSSFSVPGLSVAVTQNATSDGTAVWSASSANSIGASLVGKYSTTKIALWTYHVYAASNTTLTFTSSLPSEAVFQFDYVTTLTNGTVKIGGTSLSGSGTYEGTIAANGTKALALSVSKRSKTENSPNGASIIITNLRFFVDGQTEVTFEPAAEGGSYTVGNETISATTKKTYNATDKVTLAATPASGYSFSGWYSAEKGWLSADLNYTTNFEEAQTITAVFIPTADAIFGVGEARFDDLTAASSCAASSTTKVVVLLKDATITGDHTVALGSTLLIPYEDTNKCPTTEPVANMLGNSTSKAAPRAYRTLTLASGASITVQGVVSVAAEHVAGQAGSVNIYGGAVWDTYGCISLESGSNLTVGKGGTLYAWGYVLGNGSMNVLSGGTVYEKMQITDYRGGSNTLSIAMGGNGIFPFNQYYVQNVEVPVTLNQGASLIAHAALLISGEEVFASGVDFIGGSGAMFQIGEGATVTKRYDGASDRLIFDTDGDVAMKSLVLSVNGVPMIGSLVVNSADYVLPINGNITINVNSGMASLMQDLLLQPGTQVNVDSDAMIVLGDPNTGTSYTVYVMDSENWGAYAFSGKTHEPVFFAPSRSGNPRKYAALTDAQININGTMLNMGKLYTSEKGASIISSDGTGLIFMMAVAPAAGTVGQFTGDKTATNINVNPAQLKNGNTETPFTSTAGAAMMDIFLYDTLRDMWMKPTADITLTFDANGGTNAPEAKTVTLAGLQEMSESHIMTIDGDVVTRDNAEFKGWSLTKDGDVVANYGSTVVIGENTTLYAVWEMGDSTLTVDGVSKGSVATDTALDTVLGKDVKYFDFYKDAEKTEVAEIVDGKMPAYDLYAFSKPTYKIILDGEDKADGLLAGAPFAAALAKDLDAFRFYSDAACTQVVSITEDKMPEHDLYAKTLYTLTFQDENGEVIAEAGGKFVAGEKITAPTYTPKKENYVFTAWVEDAEGSPAFNFTNAVMPARNLTVDAQVMQSWTVKFELDNEVVHNEQANKENDFSVTINFADPTKDGYIFKGWYDGSNYYKNGDTISKISNNMVLTAKFEVECDHSNTKPVSNGDGTHDIVCTNTECKAVVKDNVSCSGGTATCVAQAECSVCKTAYGKLGDHTYTKNLRGELKTPGTCSAEAVYAVKCDNCDFNSTSLSVKGEKDADNHDWYENGYTENTGATHKIVYICRNDGTHTKTSDAIEHTYVDGVCKCNATKTYTIKFDTDGDGKVDVTLPPVAHGTAPEAPAFSLADTAEWDYTFTVWKDADDNKYESVPAATKDMTYTATYTSKKVLYSIQWMIGDKAVVDRVAYGEVPQYTGNTPTQAETAEYTYTFTGWKDADGNAPVAVTGEATYIAQFAPVAKSYTITFANTGDTVMEAKSVAYGTNIGAISEPSKVGHRFTGWTITDADGNAVKITDGKMPAKNLTYTAGWQLNEYTITWKDDEGNLIDTTTVKHGETPTHADPSKDETAQYTYTFAGWGNIVPATGPATYTAQFTPVLRSYDITFVVDGQGDKVVSTPYGQTPVYDADGKGPTKETDAQYKYTFKGWATTEGGEVADLAEVNGIATYYAIFDKTPVKHTITFMDGENVWKRIELDYDAEITDDVKSSEEKTGYTFRGWYTIEKDPETGEDMQVPYTIPEKMGAVDTVVYGNWTINSYTITFMDGETELGKITKNYNEAISAVEYTAWQTKTGYTFNSWSEAVPATMPAGDKTLTGNWTINKYTITFLNTGDTAIDSITQDFGSAVQWPADPVKNGYTFAGWDRDVITTMPAENVEVTASWTANEAVVIFMNGNEEHHRIETTTDANISEQIAAITAPTLEGYVFAGWVDADNNPVSFNKIPAGGMTVYAAFTVDTFKINFYVDDEATTPYASFDVQFGTDLLTATPDNPETEEDESKLSYLDELLKGISVPTKEGHTWKGWNTDDVPATMPAKAVNVYGTWTKNSYKITADGKDYTFEYDAAVSIPNPTKEGHTFNGWNETVPATMPANDLVLTAKWTVNSYTITFDTDGGIETIADINANFGEAVTKPADPTKTGHTFQGWSTDGVNVVNFPATMPAGGLSLKAIWAKNTIYITWIIDGNETIVPYEYGDTITVPEATKADDIKWSYKHTGWKDAEGNAVEAFGTATGPATYTAQFAEDEAVKYTVKFVDPTNEEYGYETKIAWNGEVDLEALEGFTAPTKEGNTLSWTVEGADVSFPYAMTTADVTFVAKWTPNPYTITVDGVEYPSTYGADVSVADPAPQEGKTFTGWTVTKTEDGKEIDPPANMPAYDITYTSNWTVNTYTLTVSSFDANGVSFEKTYAVDYGVDLSGYYLETPSYTDDDGTLYEFDKWSVWTWQNDDDNTMAEYTGTTMPASNVKMYSTYTFTGWYEFVPGFTSYAVKSDIAHYRNEWATIEGAEYYFVFVADKMYSYIVKDITLIDGSYYAFDHASGKFLADTTGIYKATNGDLYWIEDGVAVANKGLVRLVEDGEVHYYYFGNADNAYIAVKAGVYWVNNTNDLLPMWDYTFGEDGVIAHDDALNNNAEQTHKVVSYDDGKYYTIDGIKVHYGLFIGDDGEYYYARSSGQLVANQNYWLSESHLNGVERDGIPVEEGSYKFDAEGRIVWSSDLKNGIYAEDGGLYYYEDGVRTYAGLIELNGNLYYVRTSGQLAVGRYWVTKNNGIMASASYEFDQDGKMIRTNGLINEPDGLFYYVNGNRYHAGLIKYEGDFYYIRTNGQAVTGRTYWISHLNGYDVTDGIKEGIYEFTADGKMIIPEPVVLKNGIHEEDGKLMYYVDGKLNYAGLIQYTGTMTKEDGTEVNYDGAWIYVRTSGELAVGRSYWATKNNGYMKSATYQFDENGIMLNPPV